MYRKYLQFSNQFLKGFYHNLEPRSVVEFENYIVKRWAGHSKWQNTKHIKQAVDAQKSMQFHKMRDRIRFAVKEGGVDPGANFKLRALIEEAKKMNMPKDTLERAIKPDSETEKPYWLVYKKPKNIIFAIQVTFPLKRMTSLIGGVTKKFNCKFEKHTNDFITEKGIVITEPLNNSENAYDQAMDHAIQVGADEVFQNDDKTLVFECEPNRLDGIYSKLSEMGYKILSASSEVEFHEYVPIQEAEINEINAFIDKLHKHSDDVLKVSYNAAES